jgi:tRNA (guanine-N7-)-methyltransferase
MRTFKPELIPKPRVKCLLEWDKIKEKFGTRIDLEIGAGVGLHAIQYAQKNPNRFLVAIERTKTKFESAQRRLLSHQKTRPIKNLHFAHAQATEWVTHSLPEHIKPERLFILYPNPEPKNPQARWPHMPFFDYLLKFRMRPNHKIIFATNIRNYWLEMTKHLDLLGYNADLAETRQLHANAEFIPRTHFEKKYFARGDTLFLGEFSRL